MSELVSDLFLLNFEPQFPTHSNLSFYPEELIDGLTALIQRANKQGQNFKIQQQKIQKSLGKLKVNVHLRRSSSIFEFLIEISVDIKNQKIQCQTAFLDQEKYLCTQSSAKRKILCRKLVKINNQLELQGLRLIQDMQNGKMILKSTIIESEWVFQSKENIWRRMRIMLGKVCEVCTKYWSQILQICDRDRFRNWCIKSGVDELKIVKSEHQSFNKVLRNLDVSHINFGFNSKAESSCFSALEKSHQHQKKLKQLIMNSICDNFERNSRKLFVANYDELLYITSTSINYEVEQNQAKLYSSYLKNPVPKEPNPGQNKFIFNQIEIANPQTVKFRQTNLQGGNSKIMVAKLSFYYCDSGSFQESKATEISFNTMSLFNPSIKPFQQNKQKQMNPLLTKMIAVKLPKKTSLDAASEKCQNQKRIIRQFKSGVSAFILKYYCSRQNNFQFNDHLLLDFLPNSQPLSNYIEIFNETLSLNSKTYIIVNLVNSIRFLADYQIAHMDLNLNNFLMYRDYLAKLIDFGEAYCPHVSKSSGTCLKRGYTFPFCSPEYFERKDNFTSKQDVFSMGIIMWRLIFNYYPVITSTKALKSYKNKTYLNKIFLAPERAQAYGNVQTLDLIYRILFRCLNPQEQVRCETSWLTIFFKLIYYYLL